MLTLVKFLTVSLLFTAIKCEAGIFDNFFGLKSLTSSKQEEESKGDSKIVGGETSPVHYPYQISLQMQTRGGGGGFFFFQQPSSNW